MSTKLLGFLRVTYQENTMMYVMIIQIMNVYQAKINKYIQCIDLNLKIYFKNPRFPNLKGLSLL